MNVLTGPKNCWNQQKNTFVLLFPHSEPIELEKIIFSQIWDFKIYC